MKFDNIELIHYKKIKKSVKILFIVLSVIQLLLIVLMFVRLPLGLGKVLNPIYIMITICVIAFFWSVSYIRLLKENKKYKDE